MLNIQSFATYGRQIKDDTKAKTCTKSPYNIIKQLLKSLLLVSIFECKKNPATAYSVYISLNAPESTLRRSPLALKNQKKDLVIYLQGSSESTINLPPPPPPPYKRSRIPFHFQEYKKLKLNGFTYFFIKTVIHDRFTKHCNQ